MPTIASLMMTLGLDASGTTKGAAQATGALKGVQTQATATNRAMTDLRRGFAAGLGIGTFQVATQAVGALTNAIQDSVKGAIEDEAGMKRLTASLTANVPAWDGQTAAIERTIEARMALGFADDAQRASLAQAVIATNDVAKAQELVSTAMDLSRLRSISLEQATGLLTKAEAGSTRILKSMGIAVEEGATSTEILAAVQKAAAGQAETFADQTAGAMESAGVAIGELGEDIAQELLPFIRDAAMFIRDDLVPALKGIVEFGQDAGDTLKWLAKQIPFLNNETEGAAASTGKYNDELVKTTGTATAYYVANERAAGSAADLAVVMDNGRASSVNLESAQSDLGLELGIVADNLNTTTLGALALRDAYGLLAGATRDAADAQADMAGTPGVGGTPSNVAPGLLPQADQQAIADSQIAENRRKDNERIAREKAASDKAESNRRKADAAADKAAREAKAAADKAERERERAADEAQRKRDQQRADDMSDMFREGGEAARQYFDDVHQMNLDAIDDIRDRRNAELDAIADAAQGAVDAERKRLKMIRDRERENELVAAVGAATTPEELADAQRALERFRQDARVDRMQDNADVVAEDVKDRKAANNAVADSATAAENARAAKEKADFDKAVADLQRQFQRNPGDAAGISAAFAKLVSTSTSGAVSLAGKNMTTVHVVVGPILMDGKVVADIVDQRLAGNQAVTNPIPVMIAK